MGGVAADGNTVVSCSESGDMLTINNVGGTLEFTYHWEL